MVVWDTGRLFRIYILSPSRLTDPPQLRYAQSACQSLMWRTVCHLNGCTIKISLMFDISDQGQTRGPQKKLHATPPKENKEYEIHPHRLLRRTDSNCSSKPPSNIRKSYVLACCWWLLGVVDKASSTANPSRPPPDPKRYPNQQNLVAPRT